MCEVENIPLTGPTHVAVGSVHYEALQDNQGGGGLPCI